MDGLTHIDIVVGERPGGRVGGLLLVQAKKNKYLERPDGTPILPVFSITKPTLEDEARFKDYTDSGFEIQPKPASFSLTNTAGAASIITATSGGSQSTTLSTAFPSPLVATVTDAYGNPVSGVSVTFTAPASGASATFSNGGGSITATTNASGQLVMVFTASVNNPQLCGGILVTPNYAVATPPAITTGGGVVGVQLTTPGGTTTSTYSYLPVVASVTPGSSGTTPLAPVTIAGNGFTA